MTHHARPRAGRVARHLRRSGGRAAWLVHLIGALALFAGLLLPLTAAGQALANPAIVQRQAQLQAQARAQQGDAVLTTPTQVVAVGDFQNQLGCADFDATCNATQLSSNQGIWTGVFPLAPGSYEVAFVAFAPDGQSETVSSRPMLSARRPASASAPDSSASRERCRTVPPPRRYGPPGTPRCRRRTR